MSSELSASAQYCCGFQSAESWQTGYWVPDGLWLTSWKYWRPTALHTPSAIEMKLREGDEWRRCEKKGEARSFSAVQNTSWCVCSEAGVILRDGRVLRSHWATQKATLGRCWRDKTATWGESWTQTSGYPFPQHLFRSLSPFLCLSVFFSSSAWNRITFNWRRTLSCGGGGGQRATKKTWLFQQRDTQGWIEREKKYSERMMQRKYRKN